MFARKFLGHLEDHAKLLSEEVTERMARSGNCNELFARVPAKEQQQTMRDIYGHMTEWLFQNKSVDREYYVNVGARRAHQGVPFSQLLSAVCTARQYFWEYVERETLLDEPADFWGGVKLLHSLDSFFDSVLCFAAIGYQKGSEEQVHSAAGAAKNV